MKDAPKPKWDRHAIKAELGRRKLTLTQVALDAGLYECACRQALNGGSLRGAQAIAEALEKTVEELFPDHYTSRRSAHQKRNRIRKAGASQKSAPAADSARAA